jgi:hypothetical protein
MLLDRSALPWPRTTIPVFDRSWCAEALSGVDRLPDRLFQPYGLSTAVTAALKERMRTWARIKADQ